MTFDLFGFDFRDRKSAWWISLFSFSFDPEGEDGRSLFYLYWEAPRHGVLGSGGVTLQFLWMGTMYPSRENILQPWRW